MPPPHRPVHTTLCGQGRKGQPEEEAGILAKVAQLAGGRRASDRTYWGPGLMAHQWAAAGNGAKRVSGTQRAEPNLTCGDLPSAGPSGLPALNHTHQVHQPLPPCGSIPASHAPLGHPGEGGAAVKRLDAGARRPGSNPSSRLPSQLCDSGQETSPLCASIASLIKSENLPHKTGGGLHEALQDDSWQSECYQHAARTLSVLIILSLGLTVSSPGPGGRTEPLCPSLPLALPNRGY